MRESEYTANKALAERTARIERRERAYGTHRKSTQVSLVILALWAVAVFTGLCALIGSLI